MLLNNINYYRVLMVMLEHQERAEIKEMLEQLATLVPRVLWDLLYVLS